MLDDKKAGQVKESLESCQRPLFFFHDDPDGAASFIQMYRFKGEGKGVIVKTGPRVTADFIRRIQEYGADKIFILDLALVDDEFIEGAKTPIIWIDHHGIEDARGTTYVNPMAWGQNTPPSYMCYQIAGKKDPWLALIGCVSDWFMPPEDLLNSFKAKYPGIIDQDHPNPEDLMFKTRVGDLVNMMAFNLKGKSTDAMSAVKVFCRLDGPMELLDESTPQARWITRRYRTVKAVYDEIRKDALAVLEKHKGPLAHFISHKDRFAVTKDLSNELSYLFPSKVLVIAREKNGELKLSIRSSRNGPAIDKALEKALVGLEAHGGGHEHACGANVKKEDFDKFLDNFREALGFK